MKEKILETLRIMGFVPHPVEDWGYDFEFEGQTFLYIPNENDNYLNICLPLGAKQTERNEMKFYKAVDRVNSDLFFVKAYKRSDNHIWLAYECEIDDPDRDDLDVKLARVIHTLNNAYQYIMRFIDQDFYDEEDES